MYTLHGEGDFNAKYQVHNDIVNQFEQEAGSAYAFQLAKFHTSQISNTQSIFAERIDTHWGIVVTVISSGCSYLHHIHGTNLDASGDGVTYRIDTYKQDRRVTLMDL